MLRSLMVHNDNQSYAALACATTYDNATGILLFPAVHLS